MKSFLQFVAFALIIVGWFWLGMQWWSSVRPVPRNSNYIAPKETSSVIPVIVPAETTPATSLPNEEENTETPITSTPTNDLVDPNLPTRTTDKTIHYESTRFHYGFDMPGNVYFAWFGPENGAVHTVGIGKEDPATLADAAVRVYFYGKKVVPELQNGPNNRYTDPAGKYIYLLLKDGYSVKIEALNINHPVVQKIIETIQVF